jgi:putative ABC transport system permease protein
MRLKGLLALAGADLSASRRRALVSAAGIAVGVTVLVVVAGLGLGAREVILREVVRELPVDTIEVVPKTVDLGLFKLGTGSLFGAAPIDETTLARLRTLPEVLAAYPKLEVKLPLGARGGAGLFRRDLYTDLFMTGLPEELVAPEAPEFADRTDVVPVVISDQLIEIYNSSVSPVIGTPQLTREALTGFEFEIVVGRSLMLGDRGAIKAGVERARIVGTSRHAMRLGVSAPIATARRLLKTYGTGGPEVYRSILVQARSAADVPAITEAVRGMGLDVDETARRTSDIMTVATALASLVGLLVLVLAGLNIAHSFFASLSERRRELAIVRAVGASKTDLVLIVLAQAAFMGLAGGLAGVVLAKLGAGLLDWSAKVFVPGFPFKPETFFAMPAGLLAGALVAAVLAAVLGALWPAIAAARRPLARSLADL